MRRCAWAASLRTGPLRANVQLIVTASPFLLRTTRDTGWRPAAASDCRSGLRSRTDCRAGTGRIDDSSDRNSARYAWGSRPRRRRTGHPVDRHPYLVSVARRAAGGRYAFGGDSIFVKVGCYLGRSLCSLAELVCQAGNGITLIGVDTCRGSGPEAQRDTDAHRAAVLHGGGTMAGLASPHDCGRLHRHGDC